MELLVGGYGLVEGPVWSDQRGLIYSDVLFGGVYALSEQGVVSTVFEHRRGIGGIVQHVAGGLVVSGRDVSFKSFAGGPTVQVRDRDAEHGNVGYNDITADARGRIYAGFLGNSPVFKDGRAPADGGLVMIDVDGTSMQVGAGIGLTNGLGFSPDGRTLYHSDSRVKTVWQYNVHADGTLTPKIVFARTEEGVPDGLAVAQDGSVWVALAAGGHGVAVFEPTGARRDFIRIPVPMCTSLCFGGKDLQDLYIVSGAEGTGKEKGGSVYRTRANVAGLPVGVAQVRLAHQ